MHVALSYCTYVCYNRIIIVTIVVRDGDKHYLSEIEADYLVQAIELINEKLLHNNNNVTLISTLKNQQQQWKQNCRLTSIQQKCNSNNELSSKRRNLLSNKNSKK